MDVFSDGTRPVFILSPGNARRREHRCLVTVMYKKHLRRHYIPKAEGRLAELSGRWNPRKGSQKGTWLKEARENRRRWRRRQDSGFGTRCQIGREFTCHWMFWLSRKQIKLLKNTPPRRCLIGVRSACSCRLSQWQRVTITSLCCFFFFSNLEKSAI